MPRSSSDNLILFPELAPIAEAGWIYFALLVHCRVVKVGWTERWPIEIRIDEWSAETGCPEWPMILGAICGHSVHKDHEIHRLFAPFSDKSLKREFFHYTPLVAAHITLLLNFERQREKLAAARAESTRYQRMLAEIFGEED
jgi:hypothetical protein